MSATASHTHTHTHNLIITGLPTATTTTTATATAITNGLPNRYLCMETCQGRAGFSYSLEGEIVLPVVLPCPPFPPPCSLYDTVCCFASADNDNHWFLCPGFAQFMRFPLSSSSYSSSSLSLSLPICISVVIFSRFLPHHCCLFLLTCSCFCCCLLALHFACLSCLPCPAPRPCFARFLLVK